MAMESKIRVIRRNTIVLGTGAAGFNAADRLWQYGQKDIAMVTEGVNTGTSRNTGSDKQTYYKLTLSGGEPDSVLEMARSLFEGQCMDGDIALCEAALSVQSFLRLVELGVPFPRNRYGEYVGYKTDHDPRRRATSVGPYTSREMTDALEREVRAKGIEIFDKMLAIRILSDGHRVYGLLCLDLTRLDEPEDRFVAFCCRNMVFAAGGPAGMYADSVYPKGHYGASGMAFRAGVMGRNLTEWQYGLASIHPRWNVSGTYMQALPRFISTDPEGGQPREFLYDFFQDEGELLTKVFLKGYQWPFDVRKVAEGSSVIDILVYLESAKGRRVWLDFRDNPLGKPVDFSRLSDEAYQYLSKAGACQGKPFERLRHMNAPAMEFYKERGVDLSEEMLEIALCAQHNNGGLAVDCWWQTNVQGFYTAGEAAGSHGVYRPGGSALNAGQVGAARAARHIVRWGGGEMDQEGFDRTMEEALKEAMCIADTVMKKEGGAELRHCWERATRRMSRYGGAIRERGGIVKALEEVKEERVQFARRIRLSDSRFLPKVFRLEDILLCQQVYLSAMLDYIDTGGRSRGSALYSDPEGIKPYDILPDEFCFKLDDGSRGSQLQEVCLQGDEVRSMWREVHPIPQEEDFFENVWRSYRETGNVF